MEVDRQRAEVAEAEVVVAVVLAHQSVPVSEARQGAGRRQTLGVESTLWFLSRGDNSDVSDLEAE